MIRFGPSGIPLSCKGRTLRDGIEDVHTLGLTALEVQIVRTNVTERYAADEDIGFIPMEMEKELIIEVLRGKKRKAAALKEPMEKGDVLLTMINPIAKNYTHLKQLGEIAKNLDVVLSVHTPYYMDLVANNDLTERSVESIRWAGLLAKIMDAQIVVTHMGMYGNFSRAVAAKNIADNITLIQEWYDESGIKIPIGLETSGRQEIFGSFEEIENICEKIKGPVPVINFPHVHARGNGSLKKKEDFQDLFDRAKRFTKGRFYTHFSGVEHENGNEIRYTPIKKGDLKFEPLAECILENDMELTVISGSPLLEHDAMYMKVILERVLSKREAKAERQKAKEAEPAEVKPSKKAVPKKPVSKAKAPSKAPAKKPAPKKQPAKKSASSKAPAKQPAPKKTAVKKPVPKKQPTPSKAPTKKSVPKKSVPSTIPVKKPAPKKAVPKKPVPKKQPAKKSVPSKAPAKKPAPKKQPAKKPAAKPVPAPKSKAPVKKPAPKKKR
ncbi:MAG: TIM barrel protein [Candidatus Thermoplasmatota archaeon]|nr:TIM barrel protein [Euryarchaeota archaeon]MBU4032107.1 TIM barrel protein [Candidatus Thermoplasmatota archaeon]MBU4071271.1 TIM barrel protein [Candidatus Thermoplasmatota archaeon]MBU4144873.1 TIM barrel protein [Candidatus Thermoplasmatota archaeon]MBU4592664.1 TIM barrel protein [Candidatus Thermoplasmatota archaeon]